MDKNLLECIKNKNLIVGKIKHIDEFAVFERISLEDALEMDESELAFATPSMGRGIFKFGENGQIINIKGVDSHLDNSENVLKTITQAKAQYVITDGSMNYTDSTHPINLIIYPGNKADIRIRGTSPLEDLEIEADVNSKLKEMGVKVPIIKQIREYPIRVLEQLRLPSKIKTKSTDERIKASYSDEDKARKDYLHKVFGNRYIEAETKAKFPGARIVRLDTDVLKNKEQLLAIALRGGYLNIDEVDCGFWNPNGEYIEDRQIVDWRKI